MSLHIKDCKIFKKENFYDWWKPSRFFSLIYDAQRGVIQKNNK